MNKIEEYKFNDDKYESSIEDLKNYKTLNNVSLDDAYLKYKNDYIKFFDSKFLIELEAAKKFLEEDEIKALDYSKTLSSRKQESWYYGPKENHKNWNSYRSYLLNVKNRTKEFVEILNNETTEVVNQILNPYAPSGKKIKGLVLGYVQSGKTANMAGVIAKAADSGYKLIIVLAGLTKALRAQTQARIQNDILQHNDILWHPLTDNENDIEEGLDAIPIFTKKTTICIIKKNVQIIIKLISKMKRMPKLEMQATTLIIDDECDQASLNTKEYKDKANEISSTNKLLKQLLIDFKNVTYVGYTATPNAPFLTHPKAPDGLKSLYPSDFITPLEEPADYFGVNKLFANNIIDERGEDLSLPFIKRIPDSELEFLTCKRKDLPIFKPSLTSSLRDACDYFLLALSARSLRNLKEDHCCMMIHVSRSLKMHQLYRNLIFEEWLIPIKIGLENKDKEIIDRLKNLWKIESKAINLSVRSNLNCPLKPESFQKIEKNLLNELNDLSINVENSDESNFDERLEFKDKRDKDYKTIHSIVIGGDVLSRGLTIDGLVSSFFLRETKQDDTLMQMGRWFGFRYGYEDLPRIWMTYQVELDFTNFVGRENFYREQINWMNSQNLTPSDFPVLVQMFEQRNPTSKGKISKKVKKSASTFFGKELWTLRFKLDQQIHKDNEKAIVDLINNCESSTHSYFIEMRNAHIIKDVGFKVLLKFLDDYNFHFHEDLFNNVKSFINSDLENNDSIFKNWNVAIKGGSYIKRDIGSVRKVKTMNRTKIQNGTSEDDLKIIDIKSLTSPNDLLVDIDQKDINEWDESEEKKKFGKQLRSAAKKCREKYLGPRPLLIIYPISKDSKPDEESTTRFKLFSKTQKEDLGDLDYEPHDIFGIVIAIPTPPNFISNNNSLGLDLNN
tara:strand:+ start:97 stop:2796 length:2700 start_codon:yes stop_codon:yes gene_type:complete